MAKKKRSVNKSRKIRDYLAKHPDAGPTAVDRALKRYNVSVARECFPLGADCGRFAVST